MQKQGIRGKLFRCVKSMYDVVKARVRDGTSLTASIEDDAGDKRLLELELACEAE